MSPRFYFDDRGNYSGGGRVVLNNCDFAAARHEVFQGSAEAGDIPFIMRNIPAKGHRPKGPYVIGPQNALPWSRFARGAMEWARLAKLRAGSEYYARRATALFRPSSAVPALRDGVFCSPVLHNVLDTGFEEAVPDESVKAYEAAAGHIVSIGSGHSYRNLDGLMSGYARYRTLGGGLPLFVGGSPGSTRIRREVERRASEIPGVRIHWGTIPRDPLLATMRNAPAVVLPSLIEASPLTALEACALSPNVVMSNIIGHREILAPFSSGGEGEQAFFDVKSDESLARALLAAERRGEAAASWHEQLRSPERRAQARETWADSLASWANDVATALPWRFHRG